MITPEIRDNTLRLRMPWRKELDTVDAKFDRSAWVVVPTEANVDAVADVLATIKVRETAEVKALLDSLRNPWRMMWAAPKPGDEEVAPNGWVLCELPNDARGGYGGDKYWKYWRVHNKIQDIPNRNLTMAVHEKREAWRWPVVGMLAKRTLDLAEDEDIDMTDEVKAKVIDAGLAYEAAYTGSFSLADDGKVVLPGRFGKDAFPFQRAAIIQGLAWKRMLIGDDPGMGKTVEALGIIEAANAFPLLIIAPSGVCPQWIKEFKAWMTDPDKYVIHNITHGDATLNRITCFEADVVICSYALLEKNEKVVEMLKKRGLKAIIVDESHRVKNQNAAVTKAVFRASRDVEYRLLLSGTPMPNGVDELEMQAAVLDRLADVGGRTWFRKQFRDAKKFAMWQIDDLNAMMRRSFLLRRPKSLVSDQLPEITYDERIIELSNREEYDLAEHDFIKWFLLNVASDEQFKASLATLPKAEREAAWQERMAQEAERAKKQSTNVLAKLSKLRHIAANGKAEAAIEVAEESDEKTLIFAHHRECLVEIALGTDALVIAGGDNPIAREEVKRQFMEDPEVKRLAISMKAGGEGLNLQKASRVIMVEKDWSPGTERQAVDRAHRIGNKAELVTVISLTAENSVDDDLRKVLDRKAPAINRIMDAGNSSAPLDDSDVAQEVMNELVARKGLTWKYGYRNGEGK